jgi:hypothetical protein
MNTENVVGLTLKAPGSEASAGCRLPSNSTKKVKSSLSKTRRYAPKQNNEPGSLPSHPRVPSNDRASTIAPTSRSLATESCESDPMEAANPMDTPATGHHPNFRLRMPQAPTTPLDRPRSFEPALRVACGSPKRTVSSTVSRRGCNFGCCRTTRGRGASQRRRCWPADGGGRRAKRSGRRLSRVGFVVVANYVGFSVTERWFI